jgi:hypothetical protein
MSTLGMTLVAVFGFLLILGLAAVMRAPHRLSHRKPLETDPDNFADPLPHSTARRS